MRGGSILQPGHLTICFQELARQTMEDQAEDDRSFGSYYRTIRCTEPYPSR